MKYISPAVVITLCCCLVVAELIFFICNFGFGLWGDVASWGQLGDFFGGTLNPIFAFSSLIVLLYTLKQNQSALDLSSQELQLSRLEMSESKIALQNQSSTLEKQRFEDTFFALLNQHNLILSELNQDKKETGGHSWFYHVHKSCFDHSITSLSESKKRVIDNNSVVGSYFRILYQLLKLIATTHPNSRIGLSFSEDSIKMEPVSKQEKFYVNIVRAFLNYETTQTLAANCYCTKGNTFYKFKLLVIRYQFFEHMPLKVNGKPTYHPALEEAILHYGEEAFGESEFLEEYKKTLANPN